VQAGDLAAICQYAFGARHGGGESMRVRGRDAFSAPPVEAFFGL
jgi:hypothetical protein